MEICDQEILNECLVLLKNTGHIVEEKRVIDIFYKVFNEGEEEKRPIASIFPDDRYIQFHEEFTQIGATIPAFEKIIQWHNNHS